MHTPLKLRTPLSIILLALAVLQGTRLLFAQQNLGHTVGLLRF